MKGIKYILSIVGMGTLLFACTEDYDRSPGGEISTQSAVLNNLAQKEFFVEKPAANSASDFLFRLSWTAPRFSYSNGYPAEVSDVEYTLQAGILGNDFDKTVVVDETDLLFSDVYSDQFFEIAEELAGVGFEGNVNLEFRVLTAYAGQKESLTSNAISVVLLYEVEEVEEPEPLEELTIRFKQTTGNWEAFAVYAWGDSEVYGAWPGLVLEIDEGGWYSFVVPVNRPVNLIINNNGGGSQFDFLNDPVSGGCYEFDTNTSSFVAVDCP